MFKHLPTQEAEKEQVEEVQNQFDLMGLANEAPKKEENNDFGIDMNDTMMTMQNQ